MSNGLKGFTFYRNRLAMIKVVHSRMKNDACELRLPRVLEEKKDVHASLPPSAALKEMAARYRVSLNNDDGSKKSSLDIIKAIDFLSKDEWKCNAIGDDWNPSSLDDRSISDSEREYRKETRYQIIDPEKY